MLRVIAQLMIMLLVLLRADMLSSFIVTSETVVPGLDFNTNYRLKY